MNSSNERIISCQPSPNYHIWVRFQDGLEGIVNLGGLRQKPAFKRVWKSEEDFSKARIDPFTHTVAWGETGYEVDVNPAELRKEILESLTND
ncbi:DUF2442 domain-containing protein [Candidatus Neptunochlamydia vexilliferae]|uniref:DUF2442 domain-containing protein n=1 Tax=Candidatus Neptunichlamydia vexilliferae TaxID=1651774 RepID=A0ABS0AYC1_9BACT|nr:DUF2442 domain-containing protein [Candidatus Neptunochlamydia vexilliferae]MBF5059131.1 hypothetical protein [Candidatus Neptunochlamydia vexilliferae]